MTQKNSTVRPNSKSIPNAGMRGGLGRTLLTAFLLLSIVPLGLISFVAATQARRNLRAELQENLVTIASLTESQIHSWFSNQQLVLSIISESLAIGFQEKDSDLLLPGSRPPSLSASPTQRPGPGEVGYSQLLPVAGFLEQIATNHAKNTAFLTWLLVDQQGHVLATYPSLTESLSFPDILQLQPVLLEASDSSILKLASRAGQPLPFVFKLTQPVPDHNLVLAALLDPGSLTETIDTSRSYSGAIYLVAPSGHALKLNRTSADIDANNAANFSNATVGRHSPAMEAVLSGQSGAGSYENLQGVSVIGAYRWLPELNMGLLVEQPQASALASSEDLAVVLIGATLAMVLITALIAAAVTRRITLPIVQLTATAVQIASGDLNQKVPTSRRDEIGILARAFNVMTTKLRVLYEDLEQKVRERTQQLQEANAEVRYRAMQLATSAEVGRVVTSILDRDLLLSKVVELIRDCFQAYFVAIYFTDDSGQWAVFQEGTGGLGERLKASGYRVNLSQELLISQAINRLKPTVGVGSSGNGYTDRQLFPYTRAELAIPLKIGNRVIGVLDVHSTHKDAFAGDEIMVLETLTGQVVVAIENARAYEIERQAAERLRELEELRRRFLANMSRELRMPLNNIIGFSRVILKGIDGPITNLQQEDLTAIHDSGQQLLVLINDILDIAQIEAGAMELNIRPVDFSEIVHSVIPTINALLQGRPIRFNCEVSPNLPPTLADPYRLRQVLVKLLSNAAKFTQEGEIQLRVRRDADQIVASVIDTGIGIPDKDRDKIFEVFHQLSKPVQPSVRGTGLGLTFSKEIVEMHGGKISFESKEGKGTAFTITLPVFESLDNHQQEV